MTNKNCEHKRIGYKGIGGFPGHYQTHPVGPRICLDCGLTIEEIVDTLDNCGGCTYDKKEGTHNIFTKQHFLEYLKIFGDLIW